MVEHLLRLLAVVSFCQPGEYVVRGNLETVHHRNVSASCLPLIVQDMDVLVVAAGDKSVVGGDGLVQGFHVAVFHQGNQGDGLHYGALFAHLAEN